MIVVGTHALYAYEAGAGVRFDSSVMETTDVDILWEARSRLTLAADVRERVVELVVALLVRRAPPHAAQQPELLEPADVGEVPDERRLQRRDLLHELLVGHRREQ